MAGAIKVSRFPYGFFEKEMWAYFEQFGRVSRLKLFRSKKTGNSKGFAFVQFAHESVAKIVTETMNNYLMFDKLLKCEFIPESKIQPSMFKNWRRVMVPKLGEETHTKKANAHKDEYQEAKSRRRLFTKLTKKNEECKRLNIDYQFQIPHDSHEELVPRKRPRKSEDGDNSEMKTHSTTMESSAYSFLIDSSDDEIELKTPPNTIKKRRGSKDEEAADKTASELSSFLKDEPLSGDDDETELIAVKKAKSAAKIIKFSSAPAKKMKTKEGNAKKKVKGKDEKKKKTKKLGDDEVRKLRKVKRYFNVA